MGPEPSFSAVGQQLRLRDGRLLGYAEFGDPAGQPLFFFHGLPGCRLFRHPDDSIAAALGVRLIITDRPGFGLSERQPKRQLLDWPDDVIQLANALQLDRFAVAGVSAGGPYAAACAFKIPQRLTAVGLVSAAGPAQAVQSAKDEMAFRTRASFAVGGCGCLPWWFLWPTMALVARNARRHPEQMVQRMEHASPECDRVLLARPEIRAVFLDTILETYRQGPRGHIDDALVIARNWGFQLNDISTRTYLWQGAADPHTPLPMARFLAESIPGCQATFIPNEGHLLMFKDDYWREILSTLTAP